MKHFLLALLITLLLSLNASAQSRKATQTAEPTMVLTGVVYDINGAVILNGTIIVAESVDGKKYASAPDTEGVYKIELPLAVYKIEVGAPGFCRTQVEPFRVVNPGHGKMFLDFVLEVAKPNDQCEQEIIIEKKLKRKAETGLIPISE